MLNKQKRRSLARTVFGLLLTIPSLLLAQPAQAAEAPTISGTEASAITETSATLKGEVNPGERRTTYFFEYVDESHFKAEGFSGSTIAPNPPLKLEEGAVAVPVEAQIAELTPAMTYHFRLVASNSKGEVKSPERIFTTYGPRPSFGPCPNETFRLGHPSAALPDCRAYEQVTPIEKNGADAFGNIFAVEASLSGDAVTSAFPGGLPGAEGAQGIPTFVSRRGPEGWSTRGLLPPPSFGERAAVRGWTPDLAFAFARASQTGSDLEGALDSALLARDNANGGYRALTAYVDGAEYAFAGASADDSKLFFEARPIPGSGSEAQLIPDAAPRRDNLYLYDRATETLSLIGQVPAGGDVSCGGEAGPACVTPAAGSFAGPYDWWRGSTFDGGAEAEYFTEDERAISANGDRAYFTAGGSQLSGGGQLYLRQGLDGADPQTVHVSAPQRTGGPDPAGTRAAAFAAASADGSKAFFTSPEELTDDANAGPPQAPPAIGRAGIGGVPIEEDFLPAHHALGMAVSPGGEYLYWADPALGTIGRAKLNGAGAATEPEPEFIVPGPVAVEEEIEISPGKFEVQHLSKPSRPRYVTVDGEYVYWTNAPDEKDGHGTIGRAKLDRSQQPEAEFIKGRVETSPGSGKFKNQVSTPEGIAVNATNIYWTNAPKNAGSAGIARAGLDGDGIAPTFIPVPTGHLAHGLAVSPSGIFWTETDQNDNQYVVQTDLDGENERFKGISIGVGIRGIAVDASDVYWADQAKNAIGRIPIGDLTGGRCESDPSCESEWLKVNGAVVGLAVDSEHLYFSANGETTPNPGNDLYRYDALEPLSQRLTDLTPDSIDENGAEVQGVLGASADGSRVYFAANGDLDGPGGPAEAGDCRRAGSGGFDYSGQCSLYLWDEGALSFVAPLKASGGSGRSDAADWQPSAPVGFGQSGMSSARVSADGEALLFRSQLQQSDYLSEGTPEFYRYDAAADRIDCVSCNPTGEAPVGPPTLQSMFPAGIGSAGGQVALNRVLSADGHRVFFETTERLVGADRNGEAGCPRTGAQSQPYFTCQDVYEWEAPGAGSCTESPASGFASADGGCLYLLTGGTAPFPSFLGDASASGDHVFVFTRDQLVPQDQDRLVDVYDAGVGGGLASQNQPPAPPPCEGQGCREGGSSPADAPSPASAVFQGPGNPKAQRPKPHCARKAKRCRKHHRHHRRHRRRARNDHRRESR